MYVADRHRCVFYRVLCTFLKLLFCRISEQSVNSMNAFLDHNAPTRNVRETDLEFTGNEEVL